MSFLELLFIGGIGINIGLIWGVVKTMRGKLIMTGNFGGQKDIEG